MTKRSRSLLIFGLSKSYYQYSNEALWLPRLNDSQLEIAIYLKILVIVMLFPQYQLETLYYILSTDR